MATETIIGTITEVKGSVLIVGDDGVQRIAKVGDPIYLNDKVLAPATGFAKILLNNGHTVSIAGGENILFDQAFIALAGNENAAEITEDATDTNSEADEIQEALLEGVDPSEVAKPTEAGEGSSPSVPNDEFPIGTIIERDPYHNELELNRETRDARSAREKNEPPSAALGILDEEAEGYVSTSFRVINIDPEIISQDQPLPPDPETIPQNQPLPSVPEVTPQDQPVPSDPEIIPQDQTVKADLLLNEKIEVFDIDLQDTHTFKLLDSPALGRLVLESDGSYQFIPGPDFIDLGDDQSRTVNFSYEVMDSSGATGTGTINILVEGVNAVPDTADNIVSILEDTAYIFSEADFNFSDVDAGDTLASVTITQLPSDGVLTIGGTAITAGQIIPAAHISNLTFTPASHANGDNYANLAFTVSDGELSSAEHTLSFNVTPVADAAVIGGEDRGDIIEDSVISVSGTLTITDPDIGESVFSAQNDIAGLYGSLSINQSGAWTYIAQNTAPAIQLLGEGETLTDTIEIQSADGTRHNIVITITGANDGPQASAVDLGSTPEDTAIIITEAQLLANASDVDSSDTLSVSALTLKDNSHGSLTNNNDGTWTFTPTENFNGNDIGFNLIVTDGLASVVTTATLDITAVNDNPTAADSTLTFAENTAYTFSADDFNFSDVDVGDTLASVTITQLPSDGVLTIGGTAITAGQIIPAAHISNLTFTPASHANGDNYANLAFTVSDGELSSAEHTLSFNVTPVADAAVIGGEDRGDIIEDSVISVSGTLTITDPDIGESVFSAQNDIAGLYGSLSINQSGAWTYIAQNTAPAIQLLGEGETLTDTIEIQSADGTRHNIVMTITGANDGPQASAVDLGSTPEDTAIIITEAQLLANASDVDSSDTLSVSALTLKDNSHGSLTNNNDGTWTFTPTENFNGNDIGFNLIVTDGLASVVTTATLDITAVNDNPTAADSTLTFAENTAYTFSADDFNFSDVDVGDTLASVTITQLPSDGVLTIGGTAITAGQIIPAAHISNLTFTPASHANGDNYANLAFTVSDGELSSAEHTLSFNVTPVADAAVIGGEDRGDIIEDSVISVSGTLTITDPDIGESVFSAQNDIAGLYGSLSINQSGAWTYIAQNTAPAIQLLGEGETLTDTIEIQSADGTRHNIVMTITGANDGPQASAVDLGSTPEDTAIIITEAQLLANASDVDSSDTLSVSALTLKDNSHGSLTNNNDGTWTFTPTENFNGNDIGFNLIVTDGLASVVTTATLDITAVNDNPTAADSTLTQDEDTTYTFSATDFNFSDIDEGDSLTSVTITRLPSEGSLVLGGSAVTVGQIINVSNISSLRFTPASHANGNNYANLGFTVSDGELSSAEQTITFDLISVNDTPIVSVNQSPMVTVDEDTSFTLTKDQLLAHVSAFDADGDLLFINNVRVLSGSVLVVDNDNDTWTVTPTAHWAGTGEIQFDITDGQMTVPAQADLTFTPVADSVDLSVIVHFHEPEQPIDTVTDPQDFSDLSVGVDIDLASPEGQVVASGEINLIYDVSIVTGSDHDDTFSFSQPKVGQTYTISGGDGNNTLDLSAFDASDVLLTNTSALIDLGNDESFTINFTDINDIRFNSSLTNGEPHLVNFTNGNNWTAQGTSFSVIGTGSGINDIALIDFEGSLHENFSLNVIVNAHESPTQLENGFIVFDYQDANNYKVVRAKIQEDVWLIREVVDGVNIDLASLSFRLDSDTPVSITMRATGSLVELMDGDTVHISHDFGSPVNGGGIGVGANNSDTDFELNFIPSNWAPDVDDYALTLNTDETATVITGNVLEDAVDAEGDDLSVEAFTQGSNGTVVSNGDGTFTYTPADGFAGIDRFTYTLSDGQNLSTGSIKVNVIGEHVDIDIIAALQDNDGSETLEVTLSGIMSGGTITDGTHYFTATTGDETVNVTDWNFRSIALNMPNGFVDDFDLVVTAVTTDGSDNKTTTTTLNVENPNASPELAALADSNEAPAASERTFVLNGTGSHVFVEGDFGFSDPDANDDFNSVTLKTPPAAGLLQHEGADVTVGQEISLNDIILGKLSFIADAHKYDTDSTDFQFTVNDGELGSAEYTFNVSGIHNSGAGDSILEADDESSVFFWSLDQLGTAGDPAQDTVRNFQVGQNGSCIDLSDVLQGDVLSGDSMSINRLISLNFDSNGTTIDIKPAGDSVVTQKITLEGVDLSSYGGGVTDTDIINNLIDDGNLQID